MAKLNLKNSIEIDRRKINRSEPGGGIKTETFVLRQVNLKSGAKFQFLHKRCGSASYVVIFSDYKFESKVDAELKFKRFCDRRTEGNARINSQTQL